MLMSAFIRECNELMLKHGDLEVLFEDDEDVPVELKYSEPDGEDAVFLLGY